MVALQVCFLLPLGWAHDGALLQEAAHFRVIASHSAFRASHNHQAFRPKASPSLSLSLTLCFQHPATATKAPTEKELEREALCACQSGLSDIEVLPSALLKQQSMAGIVRN